MPSSKNPHGLKAGNLHRLGKLRERLVELTLEIAGMVREIDAMGIEQSSEVDERNLRMAIEQAGPPDGRRKKKHQCEHCKHPAFRSREGLRGHMRRKHSLTLDGRPWRPSAK